MLANVNQLSGPPVASTMALSARLTALRERERAAATEIEADLDQIRGWAVQRGMTFHKPGDLDAVNARRKSLSLPPFKLIRARSRAA